MSALQLTRKPASEHKMQTFLSLALVMNNFQPYLSVKYLYLRLEIDREDDGGDMYVYGGVCRIKSVN